MARIDEYETIIGGLQAHITIDSFDGKTIIIQTTFPNGGYLASAYDFIYRNKDLLEENVTVAGNLIFIASFVYDLHKNQISDYFEKLIALINSALEVVRIEQQWRNNIENYIIHKKNQ